MVTRTSSQRTHHLRQALFTLLALLAAGGATYFFATAGPVDPLRDTFFSLAIALDLLSIFLIWQALSWGTPWWLQAEEEWRSRTLHLQSKGVHLILRVYRARPSRIHVLWGKSKARFGLLLAAVLLYGGSLLLFALQGEDVLVRAGWLLSVLLLLLTYAQRPRLPHLSWYSVGAFLLLLVGLYLRVHRLTELPLLHHGDMASVGLQARELLHGQGKGWFNLGWATIPAWGYAHEVLSMSIWGDSLQGLRMSAVLAGLFSLWGVYLLGQEGWHPRVGLLALAALTFDVVHIHFSRIPSYIDPVPWGVWSLYFAVRGYHRRSPFSWALAGITSAVAMNMYFAGRLFPLILATLVVYLLIFHHRRALENREGLVALILGFLIGMGPMLVVAVQQASAYTSRAWFVTIADPGVYQHLLNKYQVSTLREVLMEQIQRTFLTFQYYGDTSTQFGWDGPMLAPWVAPFFLVGIGVATGKLRHVGNFLLSVWLLFGLVLGSVLTVDAPFWPRLVVITPANALALALGFAWIGEVWGGMKRRTLATGWMWVFLVWLFLSGWHQWQMYQARYTAHAGLNDFAARVILTFGERPACYVVGEHHLQEREFRFLLAGRQDLEIHPDRLEEDAATCAQHHGIVVALPSDRYVVDRVLELYPGGQLEEIRAPGGSPSLILYRLP
ncbi:MAG: glycosyltransferase family 39 protein [Chloroflexi bacterium]|nr:glycosyltransferase family 39 protein [Chloroflexota bacterium]